MRTSFTLLFPEKYNNRLNFVFLLFLFFSLCSQSIFGQTIYQYVDDKDGIPFSVNSNSVGSNLSRGSGLLSSGVTCTGANQGFGSTSWYTGTAATISTANSNGDFVSFTISPKAGYRLNLSSFKANLRAPSGGPTAVRYSYSIGSNPFVENGSSITPGTSTSCSNAGLTGNWDFVDFTTTETVTFKIYGFNTGAGEMQLKNVEVTGLVECNPAIVSSITPSSPSICVNDQITLNGATSGGTVPSLNHLWEIVSGGTGSGTLSSPGTNLSNLFTGTSGGTVLVKYTASYGSLPSCSVVSPNQTVTVNGLPSINLTGTLENCIGTTAETITYSSTTNSPNSFSLNFDATAESQGYTDNLNAVLGSSPLSVNIPVAAVPGTYHATLIIENTTTGCESPVYNLDFIQHALPVVGITGASAVCLNSTVTLAGSSSPTAVSSSWSSSNPLKASVSSLGLVTGLLAGSSDITYTATDGNGCVNTSIVHPVTINPLPSGTLTYTETSGTTSDDGIVCAGDVVSFTASSGFSNYNFKVDGTSVQSGTTNLFSKSFSTNETITVEVTDANDCMATFASVPITVGVCNVHNVNSNKNFVTIQAAIDASTTLDGHVLTVAAGTYTENIVVSKSLEIRGPNFNVSPNGGTRLPEAIVVPETAAIATGEIFHVAKSNVKILGFTINGDNPSLTSGFSSTNGADMDAAEGITVYETGVNNLTVSKNILKNLSYFGVTLYDYPAGVPSSGHMIDDNKFQDFGTYDATSGTEKWGGGVLLYNNQYAGITNNVMTNLRLGIQTGNFSQANPGTVASQTFSNNTMEIRRTGVFHNLHYSSASPFTISNNTITGLANVNETGVRGILLGSLSVNSTLNGNNINLNGIAAGNSGIEVWNVKNTAPAVISGGNISNVNTGIFLNNYDGYSSDATDGAHATISGVTISPNSTGTGIRVYDNPLSTHKNVQATIGSGVIINACLDGLVIENASAKVNSPMGNVAFTGQTGDYIKILNNTNNIDALTTTFDGQSGATATLTQNFAIEEKIRHKVDLETLGFVQVKANNSFVTTSSFVSPNTNAQIQRAIDASADGFIVNVKAGAYAKQIAPNKSVFGVNGPHQFGLFVDKNNLTIKGYKADNSPVSSASDAVVEFNTGATNNFGPSGIFVQANGVSIEGLKVGDNLNSSNAVENNKTIEVVGDAFTFSKNWVNASPDEGAIYMGRWDATHLMSSYTISNNKLENTLVSINNGVGLSGANTTRVISNNEFSGLITPYLIGFRGWSGASPVQGWIVDPVGGAIVTGNIFNNTGVVNYIIARGNTGGYANSEFNWSDIWNLNTYGNHVVTLADEPTFQPRFYTDAAGYTETRRISPNIQENVSSGSTGDVVLVSAGTYKEDVNVDKSVKLKGAGYATTKVSGPIGGGGSTFQVVASNVKIEGFEITREGNNTSDWNNSGLNTAGIGIQSQGNTAEVFNNKISGMRTGIDVNNSNGNSIHNNIIDNNRTGLIFRNQTDNTNLSENFITNNWTAGILFLDASGGTNVPTQTALNSTFNNNTISGNWYGQIVDRQTGGSLPIAGTTNLKNFECNWFGAAAAPITSTANSTEPGYTAQIPVAFGGTSVPPVSPIPNILGPASANIDYISWLTDGTDNSLTSLGFQPVPGSCSGDPVIISSAVVDQVVCGETTGSIAVTFSGGTAPYDISWTGGSASGVSSVYTIPSLLPGTYTITLTSANGSTATSSVTVLSQTVKNATQTTYFTTIQAAIDAANNGDIIEVCGGNYPGGIVVNKSLTLKGANFGVACDGTRIAESNIMGIGPSSIAVTISANDVTIDGFQINGFAGLGMGISTVGTSSVSNLTIKNNKVFAMMGAYGINVQNVISPIIIENNCISMPMQLLPPTTTTIAVVLNTLSGTDAPLVKNNKITGGFYGYLVHNVNTTNATSIEGGSISGVMQGIAVVNTINGTNLFPSNLDLKDITMSGFNGNYISLPAQNFHAGLYTYTAGATTTASKLTVNAEGLNIDGTLKPDQSSAAIYAADFSTTAGIFQNVSVIKSTLSNNKNRAVSIRGKVDFDIYDSELTDNGADAFGTGGNDGYAVIAQQGAQVSVYNTKIVQPSTSATSVTALAVGNGAGTLITANDNSITNPGNNANAKGALGNSSLGTLNALCNWWGGIAGAVSPQMSGTGVTYEFFLINGTDNDPAIGFQPVPNSCKGCSSGTLVTNTTTGEFFCKIQDAINDPQTLNGHTLEVSSGIYDEQVLVNKELTIKGVGATRPEINFTGTVSGKPTIIDVSANNVTLDSIHFNVDLSKLKSAVIASAAGIDNVIFNDNIIDAYGTPLAGSYGDRNAFSVNYVGTTNYRVATGGVNNVTFTNNTVNGTLPTSFFRSGIAIDEGAGTITGNTLQTINHDVLVRFNSNGPVNISNNNLNGGGVELSDQNAASGTITLSNNTFTGVGASSSAMLRVRNNYNGIPHIISGNTFANHDWAVSLENMNNVTVDGNTFNTSVSTAHAIVFNNKSISGNSNAIVQVPVSGTFTNNNFNGVGNAITFANHDSDNDTYGSLVLGTAGNENKFGSTLSSFILFDGQTGSSDASTFPLYSVIIGTGGTRTTTMACWDQDMNAENNKFDVGSGLQLPSAMNVTERASLEAKLTHDPDNVCLGKIQYFKPVHNVTQNTYFSTIQPSIAAAVANDVIELSEWTFNERVTIDKSLTLKGTNADITQTVLSGTGLSGTGSGIEIQNNISNVIIKKLTVENFNGGGGNTHAGIKGLLSNNNTTIDSVSVKNNSGSSGIFFAGGATIENITVTNSNIEGHVVGARGLVIWDGFKKNITFTGNTITNNNCCGIELQDGTASGVNISDNTVNIGTGDNGLGINGLRTTFGSNVISGNTITGGGRFGIEIKNPSDNDAGANTTTVSNNIVSLTTQNADLRDRAGIAVLRRGVLTANPDNHPDSPNGVIISGNTISGFQQSSTSEGFGIVVEGENHSITGNTLTNNEVGIQQQAGNLPFTSNDSGDGDQANDSDFYFGRGNSPTLCNITLSGNIYIGNGVNERIVTGGGLGSIVTAITPTIDPITNQIVCNGGTSTAISFSGNNLPGVVYSWTNSNTTIGLAASGNGNIGAFTATNSGLTPVTTTVSITAIANGCSSLPVEFTIVVNPSHFISLTSVPSTETQLLCINSPISPITYDLTGGATGADVTGLPAGVTAAVSAGVLTIGGIPTVEGPFNYSVTTTGNSCTTASESGSITVWPAATTANAGLDITACPSTTFILTGNSPVVGTGVWSIFSAPSGATSPSGFFQPNSSTPGATFIPNRGVGSYKLVWSISDLTHSCNNNSDTVVVNSIDNIPPTFVLPETNLPTITLFTTNASCVVSKTLITSSLDYKSETVVKNSYTNDNCAVSSVTNNFSSLSSNLPVGNHNLVWTVLDFGGNSNTYNQIVIVKDTISPSITAPVNVSAFTNSACTSTGVVLGVPITSDNCTVASVTNDAPTAFPLGETTVIWTVTDASGNIKKATQTVTVTDNVKPVFTSTPSPVSVASNNTSCSAINVDLGLAPTGTDNCTTSPTIVAKLNGAIVTNTTVFDFGINTVKWFISDAAGNKDSLTQTVTVTNPIIAGINTPTSTVLTCSTPSIELTATGGATYSWSNGTTLGSLATQTVTSAGTYTVTVTGTNGCTATASIIITSESAINLLVTNPASATSVDITAPAVTTGSTLPSGTMLSYYTDNDATIVLTTPNAITTAGTYYIKATSLGGCSQIKPVVVTVITDCPDNKVLTSPIDDISGTGITKKAGITLTATNKVLSGANVGYQSGHSITLNPGTEIRNGAVFKAEIKGCND